MTDHSDNLERTQNAGELGGRPALDRRAGNDVYFRQRSLLIQTTPGRPCHFIRPTRLGHRSLSGVSFACALSISIRRLAAGERYAPLR